MAAGKVLTKAAREKLKKKLKNKADKEDKKRRKERIAKIEKSGSARKPTVSRSFKKDYEVDIGRESGASASIRTSPQRKVRGTGGRAADTGSDPIVVGSKSMPSMRDAPSAASKRKSKEITKAEATLAKGTASKKELAKAEKTKSRIEESDAKSEDRRGRGKRSVTPLEKGEYVDTDTGEVVTVDRKISAKTLDVPGSASVSEAMRKKIVRGLGTRWLRNPTQNELKQQMSGRAYARYLRKKGMSPEKDAVREGTRRKTALGKGVESFGKFGSEIGQRTGRGDRTEAAVRKYGSRARKLQEQKMERKLKEKLDKADKKAKGGMGMKKKGYAKGGMKKKGMARGGAMMKKKGMAMGGLKKPATGQTGLKKLPTTVRNKMGYAKNGGMMKKKGMARGGMKKKGYAMGGMRVKYKVGGMVKGKSYGMVDNKKKK